MVGLSSNIYHYLVDYVAFGQKDARPSVIMHAQDAYAASLGSHKYKGGSIFPTHSLISSI